MYSIEKKDKKELAIKEGMEFEAVERYIEIRDIISKNSDKSFRDIIGEIAEISSGTYYNYIGNSQKRGKISLYTAKNLSNYFKLPLGIFDCTEEFTMEAKQRIAEVIRSKYTVDQIIKENAEKIDVDKNVKRKLAYIAAEEKTDEIDIITKFTDEHIFYPFLNATHMRNYKKLAVRYMNEFNKNSKGVKAFLYILSSNGLLMEYATKEMIYQCSPGEKTDKITKIKYLVKIPGELIVTMEPSYEYIDYEDTKSLIELAVDILYSGIPFNNKISLPNEFVHPHDAKIFSNALIIAKQNQGFRGNSTDIIDDKKINELIKKNFDNYRRTIEKENITIGEFLNDPFLDIFNTKVRNFIKRLINYINDDIKLIQNYAVSIRDDRAFTIHYKDKPEARLICAYGAANEVSFYVIGGPRECGSAYRPYYFYSGLDQEYLEYACNDFLEDCYYRFEKIEKWINDPDANSLKLGNSDLIREEYYDSFIGKFEL